MCVQFNAHVCTLTDFLQMYYSHIDSCSSLLFEAADADRLKERQIDKANGDDNFEALAFHKYRQGRSTILLS